MSSALMMGRTGWNGPYRRSLKPRMGSTLRPKGREEATRPCCRSLGQLPGGSDWGVAQGLQLLADHQLKLERLRYTTKSVFRGGATSQGRGVQNS